ncbi:MAG: hypothetical protein LBD33_03790 [Puniceicoccales bacterium]|nr:hypothetical protein [Puniceicoccales bacterium]
MDLHLPPRGQYPYRSFLSYIICLRYFGKPPMDPSDDSGDANGATPQRHRTIG